MVPFLILIFIHNLNTIERLIERIEMINKKFFHYYVQFFKLLGNSNMSHKKLIISLFVGLFTIANAQFIPLAGPGGNPPISHK